MMDFIELIRCACKSYVRDAAQRRTTEESSYRVLIHRVRVRTVGRVTRNQQQMLHPWQHSDCSLGMRRGIYKEETHRRRKQGNALA